VIGHDLAAISGLTATLGDGALAALNLPLSVETRAEWPVPASIWPACWCVNYLPLRSTFPARRPHDDPLERLFHAQQGKGRAGGLGHAAIGSR